MNTIKERYDLWINQRTGEIIKTVEVFKPIDEQDFLINYLLEIVNLVNNLGKKNQELAKYIFENVDKSTYSMFCTVRELSEQTGISIKTVNNTLIILENAEIIKRRVGGLRINPELIEKDTPKIEKALLTRFYTSEKN